MTASEFVLTTCGGRGMILVGDEKVLSVDASNQEVFDVTGAGDTTLAYLGMCMVNGYTIDDSVEIANLAAGIQVTKVGTSSVYLNEVIDKIQKTKKDSASKILNSDDIACFRKNHENKKIVFTNGCFDILHIGHIRYLQQASKLGDVLVVGINSDESVKRLKGDSRPINNEKDRCEMLASFGFVDFVVIFNEDTPLELINEIKPGVLVKGGDYKPDEVVGKSEVESWGGELVLLPFVEGKSTTNIINRIKD